MMLTAELELVGLIFGLYLQDAALLLHSNEGVLASTGNRGWKLGLGEAQLRIMGKNLFIPNLLTVHRPHYRMLWDFENTANQVKSSDLPLPKRSTFRDDHRKSRRGKRSQHNFDNSLSVSISNWTPHLEAFDALRWFTSILGILQLMVFPSVMFLYQTDVSVITVLTAIYTVIILTLGVVWFNTTTFGLTGKKFALLCFECLVCPPLAINLVRRFSLDMCKSVDLVEAAENLLSPEAWVSAKQKLGSRIEDQMSLEQEDSLRYVAMQTRLGLLSPTRSSDDEHQ